MNVRWGKILSGLTLATIFHAESAKAQISCAQAANQTTLLQQFSDTAPANSILPSNFRNVICSIGITNVQPTGSSINQPLNTWLSYLAGTQLPYAMLATSFVAGSPTGGSEGTGTINATGLYVNGVPVAGSLAVPTASLLGGNGSTLQGVSLGSGLALASGTLSVSGGLGISSLVVGSPTSGNLGTGTVNATGIYINGVAVAGGLSIPNANLLGGTGSAFAGISVGTGLTLSGGNLSVTSVYNPTLVGITGGTINGTSIGVSSPASGAFTSLTSTSTVGGTGFSNYLLSPPPIGTTTPAAGSFTTLSSSQLANLNTVVVGSPTGGNEGAGTVNATGLYVNGVAVAGGLSVPNSNLIGGNGSTLTSVSVSTGLTFSSGALSVTNPFVASSVSITGGSVNGVAIGASTPSTGAFTTLASSGQASLNSVVVGTPTGGNEGAGTVNTSGLYVNGVAVAGGLSVPNSTLIGGNGSSLIGVTVGGGLSYGSSTLSVTNPYAPGSVAITGGNINGTAVGASTPAAGTFTTLTSAGTNYFGPINMTGKLTTLTSAAAAGLNIGVASAAPTSPVTGDLYGTSAGLFYNTGAGVKGPFGTLASLATTSPISGGTITGSSGTISCPTCATTASGGALSASAPMAISSNGTISLGNLTAGPVLLIPGPVSAGTYSFSLAWPWAAGNLLNFRYATGGTGSPSFTAGLSISGTNVPGCSALTVSSSTVTNATCSSPNTVGLNQTVILTIASVSGSPTGASFQLNYNHTVP